MKAGLLVLLGLQLGCAAAKPLPPIDPDTARAAVSALLEKQYAALRAGSAETWAELAAQDVVAFPVQPQEAVTGRKELESVLQRWLERLIKGGVSAEIRSAGEGPRIGLAANGRAAWIGDEVTLILVGPDGSKEVPFRITEVVVEEAGRWSIIAAHLSVAVPPRDGLRWATEGRLHFNELRAGVGREAEPVVARFKKGLDRRADWIPDVADRPEVLAIGSGPGERIDGGPELRKALEEEASASGEKFVSWGGIRAGVAKVGEVAWIAATYDAVLDSGGRRVTVPCRTLVVYAREAGDWKIVQWHRAIPLPGKPR